MKAKHIIIAILLLILALSALNAQDQTAPQEGQNQPVEETDAGSSVSQVEDAKGAQVTLWSVWIDSNRQGVFGYMILLTFIIGLVYGIIRARQLFLNEKINAANMYKSLKGYLKNNQINEAITIAEQLKETTLGFIFFSGLSVYRDSRDKTKQEDLGPAVQNAFDEAVLQSVYKLDAGLFWFDTLAQICTYLGLLGTIWGLLYAFSSLSDRTLIASDRNTLLTEGIKTAIGTTALGLLAAIPLTLIKGALFTKAQRIINEIDEYCVKLINYISITTKG